MQAAAYSGEVDIILDDNFVEGHGVGAGQLADVFMEEVAQSLPILPEKNQDVGIIRAIQPPFDKNSIRPECPINDLPLLSVENGSAIRGGNVPCD